MRSPFKSSRDRRSVEGMVILVICATIIAVAIGAAAIAWAMVLLALVRRLPRG